MSARHSQRPQLRAGTRWLAGAVGAVIAGAAIFAVAPASAAGSTTDAQLSLSGVATQASILGGTVVGVHPGDTVDFKASALPTAGLDNIPVLGTLVKDLLSPLLGQYQVVAHLGGNFPGGARTVTLGGPTTGACKGAPDMPITFPNTGTYSFTWNIQYVLPLLLGCSKNGVSSANLNLLKSAGVALNVSNQWTGQIVVATNPPTGGIGIQLPGIGAAPSLPAVGQLPTLTLPGIGVQLPVTLPTLPGLPGLGGHPTSTPGSPGSPGGAGGGSTTPGGECVPCQVVPNTDLGGGFQAAAPDARGVTRIGQGLSDLGGLHAPAPVTSTASALNNSPSTSKRVDLAANKAPAAQLPVLLAIIAIIALSLVTATYARLFLLRRNI